MTAGFGEVEAGYVVALGTLATYGLTLVLRERAARRRLPERVAVPAEGGAVREAAGGRPGAERGSEGA